MKKDNYGFPSTLALAHDATSDLRHFNPGTRGSAGRLPIEEAIAKYLKYPDRSFVVDFRVRWRGFWVLVDLLHERG